MWARCQQSRNTNFEVRFVRNQEENICDIDTDSAVYLILGTAPLNDRMKRALFAICKLDEKQETHSTTINLCQ